jgi:hypothetical protein
MLNTASIIEIRVCVCWGGVLAAAAAAVTVV